MAVDELERWLLENARGWRDWENDPVEYSVDAADWYPVVVTYPDKSTGREDIGGALESRITGHEVLRLLRLRATAGDVPPAAQPGPKEGS